MAGQKSPASRQAGITHMFLLIALLMGGIMVVLLWPNNNDEAHKIVNKIPNLVATETPTPYQFPYILPEISKGESYRTIIVGDSIVASMGANANVLREKLIEHYPDSEFVNYNYGFGSTNILSLPDRLTKRSYKGEEEHVPILEQGFELIIIESFAYNPLSEFSLEEGLQKQTEILEESVRLVLREKPDSAIAFLTPIAPSSRDYGRGVVDLSDEERSFWAKERIAYIENHKRFAEERGIPVIDVYQASLMSNGLVDKRYISNDFIHPSEEGIELMSQMIADFIYENKIFPE